jgi:hypothetical protein
MVQSFDSLVQLGRFDALHRKHLRRGSLIGRVVNDGLRPLAENLPAFPPRFVYRATNGGRNQQAGETPNFVLLGF